MFSYYPERVYIRYGTSSALNSSYPAIEVSKIVVHEDFSTYATMPQNDIAILILKEPISNLYDIEYAKLPTHDFDGVFPVSVYGWGYYELCDELLKTTLLTMRTADCVLRIFPGCWSKDDCNHICAISDVSGINFGDSGGPAVLPDGTVVGIISYSVYPPPGIVFYEQLYVKIFSYLNFIHYGKYDKPNTQIPKPSPRQDDDDDDYEMEN